MMTIRLVYCLLVAAALVVAGCTKTEEGRQQTGGTIQKTANRTQETAKAAALPPGHPDISMSAQALPLGAMADATNPQWTVPKDWEEGKAAPMRRATFVVKGVDGQSAEVAISAFPGDVGGLLANVNRWRGQIGLGPVAPDEVASITADVEINGAKLTVVDFQTDTVAAGKTHPRRMIVVTLPHDGNSWFFKLTGDAPLVGAQKEPLLQFVKSVKF
jgi:predicted small secreted protein